MSGKFAFLLWPAFFLASCISISVESGRTIQPEFVTSTLVPTRAGFVPPTLTPAPPSAAPTTQVETRPAQCRDSAVLLRDVTVPDHTRMNAGEKFTKTWEFQNNGTCPWMGYTFAFAAGDRMGAPPTAPIPDTPPGSVVNISVDLAAPASNGNYTGFFTLNDPSGGNVPIGVEKTFWVKIVVGMITPQPTPAAGLTTPYILKGGNSNCAYSRNDAYVQELIARINQARTDAILPALTVNAQLASAAQSHSADMACNNFLAHTGSDGSWIGDRLAQAGYPTSGYFEIIAIGTPQDAMRQWQADQPHWEAVLNPTAGEFGVG